MHKMIKTSTTREACGDRGSSDGGENIPPEGSGSRRDAGEGSGSSGGRGGGVDGSVPSGDERVRGGGASGARGSGGGRERVRERVERTRKTVPPVRPLMTPSSGRRKGGEPKGNGVALEVPTSSQVRVGISLEDYAIYASQDTVMAMARENPGVLAAVQEELRESREVEMASLRQATLEEEEAEVFAEEFEEEERAAEAALAREEEERAKRRVIVLRRRPAFDAATYAPPVHLFVPSGLDWYVSQQEVYVEERVCS